MKAIEENSRIQIQGKIQNPVVRFPHEPVHTDINVSTVSIKQKNVGKIYLLLVSWKPLKKRAGPEPDQNVRIWTRAVDPDSLNPDPDTAFQVIQLRIRIQGKIQNPVVGFPHDPVHTDVNIGKI